MKFLNGLILSLGMIMSTTVGAYQQVQGVYRLVVQPNSMWWAHNAGGEGPLNTMPLPYTVPKCKELEIGTVSLSTKLREGRASYAVLIVGEDAIRKGIPTWVDGAFSVPSDIGVVNFNPRFIIPQGTTFSWLFINNDMSAQQVMLLNVTGQLRNVC